ncbi:MAG: hypothetical protein AAGI23_20270 [Bacteroidota bacterium]
MPISRSTYHSSLYQAFQEIEQSDYRTQVRFYEERRRQIVNLDEQESFDLLVTYMRALFELGMYGKYLQRVDLVLEISIAQNIQFFKGRDLFCDLLYQKAASHYQMMEYERADYTARELIKIAPDYPNVHLLLKRIIRKSQPQFTKLIQAAAVICFIVAAAVIVVEIFYVRTFYADSPYLGWIESGRIGLLLLGMLVYALGELFLVWRADRKTSTFITEVKKRKGYL